MRHSEALILTVALLAKRPDMLNTHLLLQERSNISQVYVAKSYLGAFKLLGARGEKT